MARVVGVFAKRLRAFCKTRGLTPAALARLTGLTRPAVGNLANGDSRPTWATVQLLALALGVSTEEFRDKRLALPKPAPPGKRGPRPKRKRQKR